MLHKFSTRKYLSFVNPGALWAPKSSSAGVRCEAGILEIVVCPHLF